MAEEWDMDMGVAVLDEAAAACSKADQRQAAHLWSPLGG